MQSDFPVLTGFSTPWLLSDRAAEAMRRLADMAAACQDRQRNERTLEAVDKLLLSLQAYA